MNETQLTGVVVVHAGGYERQKKICRCCNSEQLRDVSTLHKTQTVAVVCVRPASHTMVPERGGERGESHFALPTEKMSVLQSSFHGHWVYGS